LLCFRYAGAKALIVTGEKQVMDVHCFTGQAVK